MRSVRSGRGKVQGLNPGAPQHLGSERCEQVDNEVKGDPRGVYVHTRNVSGRWSELLRQRVKQDEVKESPIRFGNKRSSEVLTQTVSVE